MNKQLQKLIDLSNKTGDRLIVFDPANEQSAYVVMGVESYESLAIGRSEVRGLTEDELLDKINRDIAIWKSDKTQEKLSSRMDNEDYKIKFDDYEGEPQEDDFEDEDDWYSIEEIADKQGYLKKEEIVIDGEKEPKRKGPWSIPSERKEKAEEIIEEDRYYLEDIKD